MFDALEFVFNDIPSEIFKLKIVQLGSGERQDVFGNSYKIYEEKIKGNAKPYYYGSESQPPLSFKMTIARENYMDGYTRRAIDNWLAEPEYKILKVIQDDLVDVEFNCKLLNKKNIQFGNFSYAIEFTVRCDAPYGFTSEYTTTYNYTTSVNNETFKNPSNIKDYVYPVVYAKLLASATAFSIVNSSDASRSFAMTGLQTSEVLTIDNQRGIITSSTSLNRLSDSNKLWFRLVDGNNELIITGLEIFKITDKFPIAV